MLLHRCWACHPTTSQSFPSSSCMFYTHTHTHIHTHTHTHTYIHTGAEHVIQQHLRHYQAAHACSTYTHTYIHTYTHTTGIWQVSKDRGPAASAGMHMNGFQPCTVDFGCFLVPITLLCSDSFSNRICTWEAVRQNAFFGPHVFIAHGAGFFDTCALDFHYESLLCGTPKA
jgi:hypothetical protein